MGIQMLQKTILSGAHTGEKESFKCWPFSLEVQEKWSSDDKCREEVKVIKRSHSIRVNKPLDLYNVYSTLESGEGAHPWAFRAALASLFLHKALWTVDCKVLVSELVNNNKNVM